MWWTYSVALLSTVEFLWFVRLNNPNPLCLFFVIDFNHRHSSSQMEHTIYSAGVIVQNVQQFLYFLQL